MNRSNFGNTAELIARVNDVGQLTNMMRDPRYAGFTSIIIARITEIKHERDAAQAMQPQQPSVAQQALTPAQPAPTPMQGMASGGIVAFRDGGQIRGFASGSTVTDPNPTVPEGFTRFYNPNTKIWMTVPEGTSTTRIVEAPRVTGVDEAIAAKAAAHRQELQRQAAANNVLAGGVRAAPATPASVPQASQPADLPPTEALAEPYSPASGTVGSGLGSLRVSSGSRNTPTLNADEAMAKIKKYGANPEQDTADKVELAAERKSYQDQKDNALNMAAIRAGLGMMAGTSPNALQNIGQGGVEGLGQYTQDVGTANAGIRALGREERMDRTADKRLSQQAYLGILQDQAREYGADRRAAMMASQGMRQGQIDEVHRNQLAADLKRKDPTLSNGEAYAHATQMLTPSYGLGQDRIAATAEAGSKKAYDAFMKTVPGMQSKMSYAEYLDTHTSPREASAPAVIRAR